MASYMNIPLICRMRRLLCLLLVGWLPLGGYAQPTDSLPPAPLASTLGAPDTSLRVKLRQPRIIEPRRALWWSLAPGGGQIYNGRYWKAPLVYGAFVGVAALADFNTTNYNRLQRAYQAKLRGDDHEFTGTSLDNVTSLRNLRDRADKRRQTSYFGLFLVYAMQSMEAFVDAHLMTFDTRDDLEIGLRPVVTPTPGNGAAGGLGLVVRF